MSDWITHEGAERKELEELKRLKAKYGKGTAETSFKPCNTCQDPLHCGSWEECEFPGD